jgi:hypothetical protein
MSNQNKDSICDIASSTHIKNVFMEEAELMTDRPNVVINVSAGVTYLPAPDSEKLGKYPKLLDAVGRNKLSYTRHLSRSPVFVIFWVIHHHHLLL